MIIDVVYKKNWNDPKPIEIVIPTFNRVDNLIFLIKHLLKYTNTHFCISIIDNDPESNLSTEFIEYENSNQIPIRVLKNKLHLGPDASVLRALEIAKSEWVYFLGDSKIPSDDAIDTIANDVKNNKNIASIVYKSKNFNRDSIYINNIKEISSNNLYFGDFLLGGNSVFRKQTINAYFAIATQFTITRSILPIFHFLALKDNKTVYISNKEIIKAFIEKPDYYNPGLSLIECWSQFPLLANLPIDKNEKKYLIQNIIKNESFKDRLVFYKFCLINIFRENIDISFNLKALLSYRYIFNSISLEKFVIYCLYVISKINTFIKFKITKKK